MAVSKRLRYEVLRRDNYACRYCGAGAPDAKLTVDHVVASTLGGNDDPSNLVAACVNCNAGKSSATADASLIADVAQDALRWARARGLVIAREEADIKIREDDVWETYAYFTWTVNQMRGRYPRVPPDAHTSIGHWFDRGLTPAIMNNLCEVAAGNPKARTDMDIWRYFAGCAWRSIAKLDDATADLAASEKV